MTAFVLEGDFVKLLDSSLSLLNLLLIVQLLLNHLFQLLNLVFQRLVLLHKMVVSSLQSSYSVVSSMQLRVEVSDDFLVLLQLLILLFELLLVLIDQIFVCLTIPLALNISYYFVLNGLGVGSEPQSAHGLFELDMGWSNT